MDLKFPIYLDNNATTPLDPRVLEAMMPFLTGKFGNAASSTHQFGWEASEAVDLARERIASLINADPAEIVFTSGATESDNLALKGVFEMYASKGNHIITCVTEHKAVLDSCRHIEKIGGQVTYLPVAADGLMDVQALRSAITDKTVLIAIMYANNETGVLQQVQEISRIARENNILFFTDATQAVGKIPVDVQQDGIDLMAFSAHKMYGPKGVGALFVRRRNPRVKLTAQMDGGEQERGMRSGTLNVPGIVGFGMAAGIAMESLETEGGRLKALRDRLETSLLREEEAYVNGHKDCRLPNVSNISFRHVDAEALMMSCNKNIAVSSGSACTSASLEPSHVLKAMGQGELARSALRFGLGRFTTGKEIDYTIESIKDAVARLREINPAWELFREGVLK